jgi:hypothetical protein
MLRTFLPALRAKPSRQGPFIPARWYEPFHLFRYLSEQCFRFSERKDPNRDNGRFLTAAIGIFGKRLTYKKLIGCDDAAGLQPSTA